MNTMSACGRFVCRAACATRGSARDATCTRAIGFIGSPARMMPASTPKQLSLSLRLVDQLPPMREEQHVLVIGLPDDLDGDHSLASAGGSMMRGGAPRRLARPSRAGRGEGRSSLVPRAIDGGAEALELLLLLAHGELGELRRVLIARHLKADVRGRF